MLLASGAASLTFEGLFFRLAALAFGSSAIAATLVLCGFMTGLALGNMLAARTAEHRLSLLRAYAAIELVIGISGCVVVAILPELAELLAPLFRLSVAAPVLQNLERFLLALGVLLVPTTAMGMTLPFVVAAGLRGDANFGGLLGRLYGWNTAGGIVGVLLAEGLLVPRLGIAATAQAAAAVNVGVACVAAILARVEVAPATTPAFVPTETRARAVFVAAFLAGAILLALEVVWFRFFLLFFSPFGWTFASMLAIVLAGIATGGFLAGRWFRWSPQGVAAGPWVALVSGGTQCLLILRLAARARQNPAHPAEMILLMFPISLLSGAIFTICGRALQCRRRAPARSTGEVTTANTLGGAFGAVLGGFVFVPLLGLETSLFLLSLAYGALALLLLRASDGIDRPHRTALVAAGAVFVCGLGAFPWGSVQTVFLSRPGSADRLSADSGYERVAFREGRNETIRYLRENLLGRPYRFRMLTNNFSMSGTSVASRRYMKYYVYWPVAVNPALRDALLISYGAGSTAKALVDTASLEHIDVVDISSDVLDLSSIVFPDPARNPLRDPRVRVIVEDGRFHLQTTDSKYDLITAEPPPPRVSGVENLYSREFFELARERLRSGGIVTYWLPVHELLVPEAKSVVRGFCDAFPNCSLWAGMETHWMLVGMHEPGSAPTEEGFARQWRTPGVAVEMARLGFPDPESFGAFFIADGRRLKDWIGTAPPLTDDCPGLIASHTVVASPDVVEGYAAFSLSPEAERSFRESTLIERIWPDRFRRAAFERFELGRRLTFLLHRGPTYENVHVAVTTPELRGVIPWAFGSDGDAQQVLDGVTDLDERQAELASDQIVHPHLLARAVARGERDKAIAILDSAIEREWALHHHVLENAEHLRLYFLAARQDRARLDATLRTLTARLRETGLSDQATVKFEGWLTRVFPASQ
jgi:spermidine synthase